MGDDKGSPSATVELDESLVRACVEDERTETREIFGNLSDQQLNALAVDAWTGGLRALAGARGKAHESQRKGFGKSVLEDMDTQLKSMLALQEKQLDRLGKIRKSNDSVNSHVDTIENEVRWSEKGLPKLVENFEKTLRSLDFEFVNEEEVRTPVRLSSMPPVRR